MFHSRNILIDRGNTYCKVCISDDGVLSDLQLYRELSEDILESFCDVPEGVALNGVYCGVGKEERYAIDFLKRRCDLFISLDAKTPLPIEVKRYDREQIGADRLASAIGAYSLAKTDHEILVIDMGTAITYERISAKGEYLGGNISPGPQTRASSLNQATARLPLLSVEEEWSQWGENTSTAILDGVMQGVLYEIEGYIREMQNNHPNSNIFLTGGYASYFVNKLKSAIFVEPNLIMVGLNRLLEYYEQKKKNSN